MSTPKRVLVIRAGQLGDTVFASSIIEPLRRMYGEDVVIHWVAKAGMHTLFDADPRVQRVFALKSRRAPLLLSPPKLAVVRESWRAPYDLVVNLELGPIFNAVVRLVRARTKIGMPYRHFAEPAETHAVENLRLIYMSFMDDQALRLTNPSLIGTDPGAIRERFGLEGDYVVLVPSNSHFNKSTGRNYRAWPIEHWRALLAGLADRSLHVVLVGGAAEAEYFDQLAPLPANAISLVGRTGLADLTGLIAGARAVVATDTGPSHIAAAVGTPVYAIIGPTNYKRTGPYATADNDVHILSAGLPCSPCYHTPRFDACPKNQCMYDVTPQRVLTELDL